jgi:hypothetical protein
MSNCVTRFLILGATTTARLAFTPLKRELIFDTNLNQVFVGDGVTPGGISLTSMPARIKVAVNSSLTITNQDFVRVFGTTATTITLPLASSTSRVITVKQNSTQDTTIVGQSGELIDGAASAELKGNKKTSISLESQGGQWHIV